MRKVSLTSALLALIALSTPGVAGAQDDASVLTKLGSALSFYGFLRIDAVYDTDPLNDTQVPTFATSDSTADHGDADFSLYTRLTRLGLAFDGGEVMDGGALTGKLEIDFYGFDSSDSRNEARIRHAYLEVKKDDWQLLAGQTWDLFSPLYPSVNPDMLNWNMGNPGDRRPQVRFGYTPSAGEDSTLKLFGAIAVQGAIDQQNSDASTGVLDGESSGIPQLQARAAYATRINGKSAEFGLWAVVGQEESDTPVAGEDTWTSSAYGIDFVIPIVENWLVKGEYWLGENMDDLRGGIGQGINATTGDEIASMGYWIEVNWAFSETTQMFAGFTTDDPDDDDLTGIPNGRDLNQAFYLGAQYKVWNPVVIGWEYTQLTTEFTDVSDGDAGRARVWIAYNF